MMQGIATLPFEVQNSPLVPTGGLESVRRAADMLADFGREGDTYIVHAAEGETVIPVEVLDANPRMKKMLFKQMEDMGLDPERYIVGSELNSINPATGQPEFFLKKLFKSVKKVVKKIAPIVLPIAAPFLLPAMPIAFASGLGSLAGGLIAGQKPKDALKNAIITGGLAGLGNVAFGGSEGFGSGAFFGSRAAPSAGLGTFGAGQAMTPVNPFSQAGQQQLAALQTQAGVAPEVAAQQNIFEKTLYDPDPNVVTGIDPATGQVTTSGESFLEKYLSPSRTSLTPEFKAAQAAQSAAKSIDVTNQALKLAGQEPLTRAAQEKMIADAVTKAATSEAPGVLAKYGPLAATGLGVATLMPPPVDEDGDGFDDITGVRLYQQDPGKYGFDSRFYGDNPYYQDPTFMPPVTAASGGEIIGPGTPTSDSIPAMLSDGEFVMNARAVRGAGGGDRQKGAKKMYAMMKQLEGRV
jgi:hypothetical protein